MILELDRTALTAAMTKAGIKTVSELATWSGVRRSWLAHIVAGEVPGPKTQDKIAAAVGLHRTQLWKPYGMAA